MHACILARRKVRTICKSYSFYHGIELRFTVLLASTFIH